MLIVVTGKIDDKMENKLLTSLWEAEEDVTILINSGGGDGDAILACVPLIRRLEAKKYTVTTVCVGYAFSAAAMLLALGTKGRRFMARDSEMMIHRGIYQVEIVADSTTSTLDHVKRNVERHEEFFVMYSGCLWDEVRQWLNTDTYFLPEQAKENGLIDHIGLP